MKNGTGVFIVKHVDKRDKPFRLIEVYVSVDGPRTRVCSGVFRTLEEAEARMEEIVAGKYRGLEDEKI